MIGTLLIALSVTVTCPDVLPAEQIATAEFMVPLAPGDYSTICNVTVPEPPPPPPPPAGVVLDFSTQIPGGYQDAAGCDWLIDGTVSHVTAGAEEWVEFGDGSFLEVDENDPDCDYLRAPGALSVSADLTCNPTTKRNRTLLWCAEGQRPGELALMFMRRGEGGCNVNGHEQDPGIWGGPFPGPCLRIYTHIVGHASNTLPEVVLVESETGCDSDFQAAHPGAPCLRFVPGVFQSAFWSVDAAGDPATTYEGWSGFIQRRESRPLDFDRNVCRISVASANRGLGGCSLDNVILVAGE